MRKILIIIVLLNTFASVKAQNQAYPSSAGQDFANSFKELMKAVPPGLVDAEAQEALNLINDEEVMQGISGILNELTKPVNVSESECLALKVKMSKMIDDASSQALSESSDAANTKMPSKQELLEAMEMNSVEKQEGMSMMQKLTSCFQQGYIKESDIEIEVSGTNL
jgi:hypothetical protein